MSVRKDEKKLSIKNSYKNSSLLSINEDSGYSSDSSVASATSLKVNGANYNLSSTLSCTSFPTPDINWKRKLRYCIFNIYFSRVLFR